MYYFLECTQIEVRYLISDILYFRVTLAVIRNPIVRFYLGLVGFSSYIDILLLLVLSRFTLTFFFLSSIILSFSFMFVNRRCSDDVTFSKSA